MRSLQLDDVRGGLRVQLTHQLPLRDGPTLPAGARGVIAIRPGGEVMQASSEDHGTIVGVMFDQQGWTIWTPVWALAVDPGEPPFEWVMGPSGAPDWGVRELGVAADATKALVLIGDELDQLARLYDLKREGAETDAVFRGRIGRAIIMAQGDRDWAVRVASGAELDRWASERPGPGLAALAAKAEASRKARGRDLVELFEFFSQCTPQQLQRVQAALSAAKLWVRAR